MTTNVECHLDAAGLKPIAGYTDLLERHLGGDCATGARDLLADFRVPVNAARLAGDRDAVAAGRLLSVRRRPSVQSPRRLFANINADSEPLTATERFHRDRFGERC